MREERAAQYRRARMIETNADLSAPIEELWHIHDKFATREQKETAITTASLLDLKIEIARRMCGDCHFCERRCCTNRTERPGFCGVRRSRYASEFLHYGEERELVPSHTIFLTGCTFQCVFCQNWDIARHPEAGAVADPDALARRIYARSLSGARNVNWVGGDPTPHIGTILKTMRALAELEQKMEVSPRFLNLPMVFNSNTYYSAEASKLLDGVIDIYLSDFKYGNDRCAKRYSHVDNYTNTVTRNLLSSQDRVMIRHLVMPGHVQCCTRPIIAWVRETMRNVKFNLMFQYTPHNVTDYPEINRFVSDVERREATNIAKGLNLI